MSSLGPLLDALPLAALAVRADERIEAANDKAHAMLGPALGGRHFVTALRQPGLLSAVETALRTGEARSAEYLQSGDRRDSRFHVSVAPVPIGQTRGVLVVFEDVSQLDEAGQMRRDFVANVSHELRTPLTALIGFIETLKGPARDDPEGRARFLDIMEREAHRMNRLVGDLLSLSRVEADERVRPTDRLDPGDLVRSTVHGLMPLARDAGVALDTALPEEALSVPGDFDQIRQVLTNLMENAIKYAGRGASVTVSLRGAAYEPRLRGDGIRIVVADTGPGIAPHHIPRLTERFYRVDSHRSREMGGTGLGLAIVKHIVNRHRGRLMVESTQGQGSRFTIIMPAG